MLHYTDFTFRTEEDIVEFLNWHNKQQYVTYGWKKFDKMFYSTIRIISVNIAEKSFVMKVNFSEPIIVTAKDLIGERLYCFYEAC